MSELFGPSDEAELAGEGGGEDGKPRFGIEGSSGLAKGRGGGNARRPTSAC